MADLPRPVRLRLPLAISLGIWRCDLRFRQYPFGPPRRTIAQKIAWGLYHYAIGSVTP